MKKVKKAAVLRYFFYNKKDELEPAEIDFILKVLLADNYRPSRACKFYTLHHKPNQVKTLTDTDKALLNCLEFKGTADKETIMEYLHSIGTPKDSSTVTRSLLKMQKRNLIKAI